MFFFYFFFFFSSRRRHTRYIGDWSSDVCSSDLSRIAASRYSTRPASSGAIAASARTSPSASRTRSASISSPITTRSEERRVGKECRARGGPYHRKEKKQAQ